MQNVLVINTVGFHVNGVSTVIMNLYNETKGSYKYDFTFPNYMDEKFIKQLEKKNRIFKLSDRKKRTLNYIVGLTKIIRKNNYDVIHIHGNSNTMLIEILSAKLAFYAGRLIIHTHNTNVGEAKVLRSILNRILINSVSRIVACGNEAGKALYGSRPFDIICNGIDLEEYSFSFDNRNRFREEIEASSTDILIGHVGRMNDQKNQDFLLDLMKYVPETIPIKLVLIGDGVNENLLKKKAAALNIDNVVIFLGPREKTNYIYSGLDVLVMPSKYEGVPLVAIEAQAANLPVIISNKVDREINITNFVSFLPIDKNEEVFKQWFDQIKKYNCLNRTNSNNIELLRKSGFDIKNSGKEIKKLYMENDGAIK